MKTFLSVMAIVLLGSILAGCGSSPTQPKPIPEDWSFPADSQSFALCLYSPTTEVNAGQEFDARVVAYNLSGVFGAAGEVAFDTTRVEVYELVAGPFISPSTDALYLLRSEPSLLRVSFAATYRAGSGRVSNGSGVLFKLKCRAKASGRATFAVVGAPDLRTSTGQPIPHLPSLELR